DRSGADRSRANIWINVGTGRRSRPNQYLDQCRRGMWIAAEPIFGSISARDVDRNRTAATDGRKSFELFRIRFYAAAAPQSDPGPSQRDDFISRKSCPIEQSNANLPPLGRRPRIAVRLI